MASCNASMPLLDNSAEAFLSRFCFQSRMACLVAFWASDVVLTYSIMQASAIEHVWHSWAAAGLERSRASIAVGTLMLIPPAQEHSTSRGCLEEQRAGWVERLRNPSCRDSYRRVSLPVYSAPRPSAAFTTSTATAIPHSGPMMTHRAGRSDRPGRLQGDNDIVEQYYNPSKELS